MVLGQVAKGVRSTDLRVGMEMQVAIEVLSHDDEHDSSVYVWEPVGASDRGRVSRLTAERGPSAPHAAPRAGSWYEQQ